MADAKFYYYIDGVEYDPWAAYQSADAPTATFEGILTIDSFTVASAVIDVDWSKIGSTGYGSTDIFYDDFVTPGFPDWSIYTPGVSPISGLPYLTQVGSNAHMEFHSKGIMYNPGLTLSGHDANHTNVYWLDRIAVTSSTQFRPRMTVDAGATTVFLLFKSDAILIIAQGWHSGTYTHETLITHPIDLTDGWHLVGVRRELLGVPEPIHGIWTVPFTEMLGNVRGYGG